MEARAMERYRGLIETGAIFLVGAVMSAMKQLLADEGEIDWRKTFARVLSNILAGVGIYSFLLSYRPWFNEYPQKIGVIMFLVYVGSRLIDVLVDKLFDWIKYTNFKEILRILFGIK